MKENGVVVSREQVNSSNYKMVPRTATVGVATDNPSAYTAIQQAIATGSIDHVKSVANALKSGQYSGNAAVSDPALAALLVGKSAEEQEALIRQYNEQLAQQRGE